MTSKFDEVFETSKEELTRKEKDRIKNPIAEVIIFLTIFSLVAITVIILVLMIIDFIDLEKLFLSSIHW
ncbi:MAG: hypothetical protein ACFFFH_07715 [Candidatus Thorarchaeota archaeon]